MTRNSTLEVTIMGGTWAGELIDSLNSMDIINADCIVLRA